MSTHQSIRSTVQKTATMLEKATFSVTLFGDFVSVKCLLSFFSRATNNIQQIHIDKENRIVFVKFVAH